MTETFGVPVPMDIFRSGTSSISTALALCGGVLGDPASAVTFSCANGCERASWNSDAESLSVFV